jgi:glycosyltransferase involved in cell wall biosynthesis
MESKKILILSHKPPYPKVDGGCIAIAQTIEALLEKGHLITVLCMETDKHRSAHTIKHKNLKFECVYIDSRINVLGAFKNIFKKDSYILSRFNQREFENKIIHTLSNTRFDTILFESLFTSPYIHLAKKYSKAKTIYRSHNIEHLIWDKHKDQKSNWFLKKYIQIQANRLKKEELAFWNEVGLIASISSKDSKCIKTHTNTPISTLGLYVEKRHKESYNQVNKNDFFHLGAMDWLPNIEAINWLITHVWPKFNKLYNNTELHIAGRAMPANLKNLKLPGLFNHAEVDDALNFISQHKIMLVPLISGSGIRVKIIEGMALGKCIISTSIGVEGIPCTNKKNILIADTPEQFITAMKFCIENKEQVDAIGDEAKILAQKHFSKKEFTNQLEAIL